MIEYKYVAKDKSGRTVSGQRLASSRDVIAIELERQNLVVVSIEEFQRETKVFEKMTRKSRILGGGRIRTLDLIILTRQLATMLQGGVPILRAIEGISEEIKNKRFKAILESVSRDIKDGNVLSESLRRYPDAFSELFVSMVEAGEKVGSLDKMLNRLASYLETRERLAMKIRSATTYPAFVFLFFLVAMGVITLWLIPRFQSVYEGFGAELPALTLAIFTVSNFIIDHAPFVICALLAIIFSIFFFVRFTKKGRMAFDRTLLRIPLFGPVIKKAAISKFCRTLSTLLGQGITITDSLLLVGRTAGNTIIEEASNKASKLVVEGEEVPAAFKKMKLFPSLMMQMVTVGAEAGSMPELLDKTADFYEDQVDTFISSLTAMIEPMLIIGLGAVIAVVVIALYLPIFKLGDVMHGGIR